MRAVNLDELPPADPVAVAAAIAIVEERCAADPDLVHGDVVEMVAMESELSLAVALCVQTMGFVPDTVRRRIVEAEFEETIAADRERRAEQAVVAGKAAARSAKAAATRAATAARESAEQAAKMRSNRCDVCFQVRSPAGTCGCD
ncbi:MAG: hypothetical protein Q8R60_07310 [Mycobacteriales bacterium]|nr:hypothetical protein [Mycobacteriales bacterium]